MTFQLKRRYSDIFSMASKWIMLFLFAAIISSCDDQVIAPRDTTSVKTIVIFNHTGHLVQQSSDICGEGITVKFVLSSSSDQKEYIFAPDSFRSVSLDIEKDEVMNIKVFEVNPGNDILLTEVDKSFTPGAETSLDLPTMILCPKDQLEFLGF